MFWNLYFGEPAVGADFTFLIGFTAALMLFGALAWSGMRSRP